MVSNYALITGASRGIGAAIARAISEQGTGVILLARSEEALNDIAGYLQVEGGVAHSLVVDLSISSDLDTVYNFVMGLPGELQMVVHCAGVAKVGKIDEMNLADWKRVIDVNLTAPFMLTQKLLPLMKSGSQFVFINSVAGKRSFSEWGAYSASKHGLRAFADTLREEVRESGIRVTSIYPTTVDSSLHNDLPYKWNRAKMMKPKDMANAVVYILKQPANISISELDLENISGTF